MSFAPHCGHFLLYKRFYWRCREEVGMDYTGRSAGSRKEKTSEKIMTVFHLKEINIKNVIYISTDDEKNL